MPGGTIGNIGIIVNLKTASALTALAAAVELFAAAVTQNQVYWALGVIGTVATSLLLYWQRLQRVRREEYLEWEKVRGPSLSQQIAELTETIDSLRASLHASRNEANAHALQAQSLRQDLQNANTLYLQACQELSEANRMIRELTGELHDLHRQADRNTRRIDAVEKATGSSDEIPAGDPA